jgi:hypothetical protein
VPAVPDEHLEPNAVAVAVVVAVAISVVADGRVGGIGGRGAMVRPVTAPVAITAERISLRIIVVLLAAGRRLVRPFREENGARWRSLRRVRAALIPPSPPGGRGWSSTST